MSPRWLEMRLSLADEDVELVSQILTDLGSVGIISAEHRLDTFVAPDPHALRNDPVLRAFFPWPDDPEDLRVKVLAEFESLLPLLSNHALPVIECRELADEDWASSWQQHFPPFRIGARLVIHPSWVEWPERDGEILLTLDPGQAFGTGTHATTSLCLACIDDLSQQGRPFARVLDVGTGSGILAMAAAALGAETVLGCDIDPESCRVAEENVVRNGLSDRVTITGEPIENIEGEYDLLLANILASENIRLGSDFLAHLAQGGSLVLSGILIEQEAQVRSAFEALPVELVEVRHREEWTCMVYRRHE